MIEAFSDENERVHGAHRATGEVILYLESDTIHGAVVGGASLTMKNNHMQTFLTFFGIDIF